MLIGSVDYDGNPRLYMTDPVGYHWGYLAAVIGRGSNQAGEFLESNYKRSIKTPAAIKLALDALRQASDSELDKDNVEIAKIPIKSRKFTRLSDSEVEKYLAGDEPAKKTPE
jgi:20S proteasome alpha/beta subunit